MTNDRQRPSFAISIEWENTRFGEDDRTRRMLRSLRAQLIALGPQRRRPEVFFLYDRHAVDGKVVEETVAQEFQPDTVPAATRIVPGDGMAYYEQKNAGARLSNADIKICLDCDVIPEEGWLEAMLDAFDRPEVDVVAGQTYIDVKGLYSRAFALFWFFHLRDPSNELVKQDWFHANNVAFRAEVFERNPFPRLPAFRGQCIVLAETLTRKGHGIYLQNRARVSHPSPGGFLFFIIKALINGRDQVVIKQHVEGRNRPQLRWVWWGYNSALARSRSRIKNEGPALGLGPTGRAVALAIATAYLSIKALGGVITVVNRDALAGLNDA